MADDKKNDTSCMGCERIEDCVQQPGRLLGIGVYNCNTTAHGRKVVEMAWRGDGRHLNGSPGGTPLPKIRKK